MGGQRLMAYSEAYSRLLAEMGINSDDNGVRDRYYPGVVAQVDAQLDAEELRLSGMIWGSAVAEAAEALVVALSWPDDPDRVITTGHFLAEYEDARQRLFRLVLEQSDRDMCRKCLSIKPRADVQLVLVDESILVAVKHYLYPDPHHKTAEARLWVAQLCGDCRTPTPAARKRITVRKGKRKWVKVFRNIIPVAEAGGFLWVLPPEATSDDDFEHIPQAADRTRYGPAVCTPALGDELGIPPPLSIAGQVGEQEIVIQRKGYTVRLISMADCLSRKAA